MKEFYFIKKCNKIISIEKIEELVTRMRELEWNSRSDNRDYMHVYSFWRNKKSNIEIRYENEQDFIEDLFRFDQIVKVNIWDFILVNILRRHRSVGSATSL